MRKEVVLHVYDVTSHPSEKVKNTILQINRIFKDGIGIGGVFHSAIQVHGDDEWCFGSCGHGSGVYACSSGKNPLFTYHERIVLGQTSCSISEVNRIIEELRQSWPGNSYDLLSKNCNHFCDAFCEKLGVPKPPGWVNRFANAANSTMVVSRNAAFQLRQAKAEIVTASKVAYRFMAGLTSNLQTEPVSPSNSIKDDQR